jgi:hypothetical protein
MKQSFLTTLKDRVQYFIHQGLSVKIFFLSLITFLYCYLGQQFDWVYVVLVAMLLAFREGKELLVIWKGNNAQSSE